ncbi:FMN-binding protein [Streptomyces sp. NPDC059142]|uniref:FMN-binding protein n=1 Tax=Streptomyces sp. NPDC059142 TaxID=3346739 RepID=UPI0036CF161F
MKRKHPLRRIMIGVAATASGIVLLLALKQPGGSSVVGATAPPGTAAGASAGAAGATGGQALLGDAVDTQYGPVQVRLTLAGGKITRAEAVQAPGADARSRSITADAVPKLNQAAVTAQSARIDAVTGASYTSKGYQESLQSALDKAGTGATAGADATAGSTGGGSAEASGPDTGAGAGTGTDTGAGEGTGTGADTGAGAGTGADTGAGTGADTGAGTGADTAAPRTVLGSPVDTQYGTVQVRITVAGGKVTASDAVQAPSADARSKSITSGAVPKLNQAAVTAQSARIDAVSGASYTSKGYQESLQSALDQAGL